MDFDDKKNKPLYALSELSLEGFFATYHHLEYINFDTFPKDGPVILLPKHQSMKDIPLEGAGIRRYAHRSGNWIMRSSLPGILGYVGGIAIPRQKEMMALRRIKDRTERENARDMIVEKIEYAKDYSKWLLEQGQIVVIHPEATRVQNRVGQFKAELIHDLISHSKYTSLDTLIIPLGINYEAVWQPGSKVTLTLGSPIEYENTKAEDLEDHVMTRIAELSRLPYNK